MDPEAGTRAECVQCHTPHGSPNLSLVRERIVTPGGTEAELLFDNRDGRADGSFASVSEPGAGVWEGCHRSTRHYRSDGSGSPHFPTTCVACHEHTAGFAPSLASF